MLIQHEESSKSKQVKTQATVKEPNVALNVVKKNFKKKGNYMQKKGNKNQPFKKRYQTK